MDYETGEYKTKALNSKNVEIFTEYEQVEPVANSDGDEEIWYEKEILKVKKDGKYGLIDLDGGQVIPAEYDDIETFSGNTTNGYIIKKDDKYGLIDSGNNEVLPAKYDEIKNVHGNNLYVVTEDGTEKIIDKNGQSLTTKKFDDVISISEIDTADSGIVFETGGKYGFMDLTGNIKINATYDYLMEAKQDTLIAKKGDVYGVIDASEKEILPFENSSITYNKEADIYIIEDKEYNAKVLNSELEEKLSGIFLDMDNEKDYIEMRVGDEYKYYNFAFEEKPASTFLTSNTLFISKQDGKYGFIDKDGNVVVDYQYDDATEQNSDGYAGIKKDGKWGCIDNKGKVILQPTYELDDYLQIDFIGKWHKGKELNMNYYTQD